MTKEMLKWGSRPLTKAETDYLNRSLDEIAIRIGQLADDIMTIAQKIREGLGYQKEFHKSLLELNDLLSGTNLINLEKGLKRAKMELLKKSPEYVIHGVLKGQLKQRDVIELMEHLYKAQQQQAEALPQDVRDLLKGKLTPSQFVLKKKVEAERRAS